MVRTASTVQPVERPVRKAGTVKSFKSPEGKWMIKAEDAQAYLEAYYQRNLAPENTAKGNAETKPALAKV